MPCWVFLSERVCVAYALPGWTVLRVCRALEPNRSLLGRVLLCRREQLEPDGSLVSCGALLSSRDCAACQVPARDLLGHAWGDERFFVQGVYWRILLSVREYDQRKRLSVRFWLLLSYWNKHYVFLSRWILLFF